MTEPFPIPDSPAGITPAWLTTALRAAGLLADGSAVACRWERIGAEFGFTGVVARLFIQYSADVSAETPPSTIVAKLPMAEREVPSGYRANQERDPVAAQRNYERSAREVRFYREIAPRSSISVPRLYYAASDNASRRIVLLLEDLADTRQGDMLIGCSPSEAARVLAAVVPLHAMWWDRSGTGSFPWLPRWGSNHAIRTERYAASVSPFLDRYGAKLPPEIRSIVARLRSKLAAVFAHLIAAPFTVIHGDLHLDNVAFAPKDAARPAVVLDWQSVSWGPAALELAFFLVGSLVPDNRRHTEPDLLRRYHAALTERGVTGYPLDRLITDYRLALLVQLAGTVTWLAHADPDERTGRERALMDAALGDGRLIAALIDHDALGLLATL